MSKFTKLTFVAIFALLIVGSLFAVEARDLRRQESGASDSAKSGLPSATTPPDATGTGTGAGTDVPDTPPTAPTDAPTAPPADSGVPGTGKASDIASLLNSAAQSGVPPSAAASPSPSSGSGSGPATTPSSANKIENGIFGVAIAALVSLLL